MTTSNIELQVFEVAFLKIISHLRESGIEQIELGEDFYWALDSEEMYDPYRVREPKELGQMTDDWNEIKRIATGESDAIGYALVWLSSLCKYIGNKYVG